MVCDRVVLELIFKFLVKSKSIEKDLIYIQCRLSGQKELKYFLLRFKFIINLNHSNMSEFPEVKFTQGDPQYRLIKVISSGNFGYIFEAQDAKTNEKVAIKRINRNNPSLSREYEILTMIRSCQNVVEVRDIFFTRNRQRKTVENIVFQFVEDNLKNLLTRTINQGRTIPEITIKNYMYQLLNGINQIHSKNITHRDLKPSNILLSKKGKIKVCDFGSSKILQENGKNTPYIGPRIYRAPQLLLCMSKYTNAIDIWSVGCIMSQFFLLKPLFDGNSEGNQLFEILKCLGSFSGPEKKEIQSRIPFDKSLLKGVGPYPRKNLNQIFNMVDDRENFLDLLLKMFSYLPQKRIKANEAMQHPFFDSVRKIEGEHYHEESTKH